MESKIIPELDDENVTNLSIVVTVGHNINHYDECITLIFLQITKFSFSVAVSLLRYL